MPRDEMPRLRDEMPRDEMPRLRDEEAELHSLRKDLDKNFKPIFKKYGGKGLPVGDLKRQLEEEGLLNYVPRRRMYELLNMADRDGDKNITYTEFCTMVSCDMTDRERKPLRHVVRAAIAGLVSRHQREDFLANYNCFPPPLFIPIISIAEIAVFCYYVHDLKHQTPPVIVTWDTGWAHYSPLPYLAKRRYEAWRFITYMLMHQGYEHIVFNMVHQLIFGIPLEIVHKWWRVLLIYVIGSVTGALLSSVIEPNINLVGASGGCYAILGAHVAAIIINWREMNYKCTSTDELEHNVCCGMARIVLSAPVRLVAILLTSLPNTAIAIYRRVTAPDEKKIGVLAHIGGFVAGMFLGVLILRNVNRRTWERRLGYCTVFSFILLFVFCILFNIFYTGYPAQNWSGWD